ncbi:MAG: hypothetical protein GKR99_06035 [Rhodobacteraceae bacterium]|nr:hypothetical protein [Paracoccaceae bacterium]
MNWIIWTGAGVALLGLAGIFCAIWLVMKARNAGLSDDELRARVQKVLPLNMIAVFVSAIGLMIVVLGIVF